MSMPGPDQTVHMMNWFDVVRVYRSIEGRDAAELELYTTDDLRRLYQGMDDDLFRLRDGIVNRVELVATIRWRILMERVSYIVLLTLSAVAAIASIAAAIQGWK